MQPIVFFILLHLNSVGCGLIDPGSNSLWVHDNGLQKKFRFCRFHCLRVDGREKLRFKTATNMCGRSLAVARTKDDDSVYVLPQYLANLTRPIVTKKAISSMY